MSLPDQRSAGWEVALEAIAVVTPALSKMAGWPHPLQRVALGGGGHTTGRCFGRPDFDPRAGRESC